MHPQQRFPFVSTARAATITSAAFILACAGMPRASGRAANDAVAATQARHFIDSLRRTQSIPGMAATVFRGDREIWSEGFGLADVDGRIPATPVTLFRVGSVTKLLTAVSLMRLVDRGVVQLDAPVNTYLDGLPTHWSGVTLRQLAGHTAGVRHYRGAEFFSRAEYPTLRAALGIFVDDSLLFPAGTRYGYSSYGYNLIGAVLEAVTSQPFPRTLKQLVLDPLRLSKTLPDSAGKSIPDRSTLYRVTSSGVSATPADNLSSRWPSGGYLSTTRDLARFGSAAHRPGLLSDSARRIMVAPQRLPSGDSTRVGIGWRVGTDAAGRRYYHHGGTSNGGAAFLIVYPREQLVVAMASNAFAAWSEPEAVRVAALFLH
ncbi:MAG: serine hydrolase domain-containing protein [Gemmatimonadaceae bacterium]